MNGWEYSERKCGKMYLADAKKRFTDCAFHLSFSHDNQKELRKSIKTRMALHDMCRQ